MMQHLRIILAAFLLAAIVPLSFVHAGDWPMWRHDAARTGATPDALPAALHLQWSLELPRPHPAWRGEQDKLQFDRSYEPIAIGKLLIVPSMVRGSVTAYDTDTAEMRWRFYADGPVRFAPAAHGGNVYFVSDDGFLYCLRAADGALQWKLRGGPNDTRILGNERLISAWPARGGPVIKDGIVYFAASIWPLMGTFIHAVDAKTGQVAWTNSGSGSSYIVQQHGSPAFAGVAPQGYLAANDDTLLVAGGRTVPAAYERKDGAFRFFLPGSRNAGKDAGGYAVTIGDKWFFNRSAMYEMEKGNYLGKYRADLITPGKQALTLDRDTITLRPLPPVVDTGEIKDIRALWTKTPLLKFEGERKVKLSERFGRAFMMAGERVYVDGDDGEIAAITLPKSETDEATITWRGQVRGNVFNMLAADDRLFVITSEGWIFCFGDKPTTATLPDAKAVGNDDADGLLLLVRRGSEWKTLETADTVPADWTALKFDDGAWEAQRVELDEDDDSSVVTRSSPDEKTQDSKEELKTPPRSKTYYYRHIFTLRDKAALADVKLMMMTDDATAIHINGKPLPKLYEKDGTPDAKPPRDPKRNKRASHELPLDVNLLVEGRNVIAIALPNQRTAVDADDLFNFEIIAEKEPLAEDPAKPQPQWMTKAGDILKLAGPSAGRGVAAIYGAADGTLVEELRKHTHLNLIAIEPDATKVTAMRERFDKAQLLGERVAFHTGTPATFSLPPYLLNLAICEDMNAAGCTDKAAAIARVYSALRPYGGVAVFGVEDSLRSLFEDAVKQAKLHGAELTFANGYAVLRRAGAPQGAGDWTHQNGDSGNTLVSSDSAVKLPLGVLWFGGPSNAKILPRHGHGPVPQVIDGRLIIEGPDLLRAMDIYTGRLLWDRKLPALGLYYNNTAHHPGAGAVGGNYVSLSDAIYVAYGRKILKLDPVTGKTVSAHTLPNDGAERLKVNIPVEKPKVAPDAAGSPLPVPGDLNTPKTGDTGRGLPVASVAENESPYVGFIGVHENFLITTSTPLPALSISRYKPDATSLEARYGEGSRRLLVLDRHTGDVLWKRDAAFEFRHNAIVAGTHENRARIFCIDRLTEARVSLLKKRGVVLDGDAHLYALDAKTGEILWKTSENMSGTWLGYSEKHDVVLQAGSKSKDRASDETERGMVAYRGSTGELLWQHDDKYAGPPLLHDRTVITQGEAYDLLTGTRSQRIHPITGQSLAWDWQRNYGCNTALGCVNLLTFRSAAAGYFDLAGDGGTGNLGGFRSSCTNNLVPAGGILSAPDYTRTCICSYQNQTSLALIHMPSIEVWTFNPMKWDGKPVHQVGINFGAPGDHRVAAAAAAGAEAGAGEIPTAAAASAPGTLWLDYPSAGGKSPDVPIKITTKAGQKAPTYFRYHASHLADHPLAFVAASGVMGEAEFEITLADKDVKGTRRYTVRLVFAEVEAVKAGQRVFDVALNGKSALKDFDIADAAGGVRRVVVKEIRNVVVGEKMTIALTAKQGSLPPVLGGVEIVAE